MSQADIGLVGLAVMGQNLVLNMADHGFTVAVYNRTTAKVDEFLQGSAKGKTITGAYSVQELVQKLKRPRKIMLLVKAGEAVDEFIEQVLPYLEAGDILIDGGNSYFPDTNRRCEDLKKKGILYVGCGVSGGEVGARHGPSLMPGGNKAAWEHLKPIFQSIAAKADGKNPCCDWVGDHGAGHYVKMVHNGIEYGDMQLICEAYDVLQRVLGCNEDELAQILADWNRTELDSYLIEITGKIFAFKDQDGQPLIRKILDFAGQKGTGKWTSVNSIDLGIPGSLMVESLFARYLSALKEERVAASKVLAGPKPAPFSGDKKAFIESVRQALYASKIMSYAQGFMLIRQAAENYGWGLNYGSIALMWREGCIIRSKFLGNIKDAFVQNPQLKSLLMDKFFQGELARMQNGWRKTVATAAEHGVPVPCFSAALSFYDGYRSSNLPANLLQAQRDYFGAHTYERTDKPRGQFFHTDWAGTGGNVSSTSYNA
ncbi:MAG: pGD [Chlamydiales bacterium]|jgi:6-phosphogluconate dehydrogenase|nr:pGD [Chlamydiales bacterium]